MSFLRIIFFTISVFVSSSVVGQSAVAYRFSEISFNGLEKTDEYTARRLTHTSIGDTLDEIRIISDAQKLKNFPGIGAVSYSLDTLGNDISLHYDIEEIRTLLPILNFGGIKGNVWYQIGFSDINWRGKGQQLSAYYQNSDNRHSGSIFYRVPRMADSNWGYSVNLSRWASREPLYFADDVSVLYDFDYNNIGLTGIYQFDSHRSIEFGGSYFVEQYRKIDNGSVEIQPGPDKLRQPKLLGRVNYREDFINYFAYLKDGFSWQALYQNVVTINEPMPFNSLILQSIYYKLLPAKTNIAMRIRFGISTNNDSPFAPFVVDSHVNLRGVGNRIDRGTAQLIFNLEIRKAIFESNLLASQIVAFTDLGSWRDPGGQLSGLFKPDGFRHFVGGGFRLIYKKIYGATLRVDYGVDIYNPQENGVVLGFGQYF